MREASVDLVGLHDFRSFCKIDITNDEPTFMRRIKNVQISLLNAEPDIASSNPGYVRDLDRTPRTTCLSSYQMCELIVDGSGSSGIRFVASWPFSFSSVKERKKSAWSKNCSTSKNTRARRTIRSHQVSCRSTNICFYVHRCSRTAAGSIRLPVRWRRMDL